MIIRKRLKQLKRLRYTGSGPNKKAHVEQVLQATFWFLFIPVYTRETIVRSTLGAL